MLLSFIIPAFNEEAVIAETIQAIKQHCPENDYEIIVVDNGSTDRTGEIAASLDCQVIYHPGVTIAALRNRGRASAQGKILIFLDADVHLTKEWNANAPRVFETLLSKVYLITGSRCLPDDSLGWLNKYWFGRLKDYDASYVNSGHMITTRELFDRVNGFDEELKTAEDYDFCQRAIALGAEVKNDPGIPVVHLGYPSNIRDFIRRERWHGRSDFESIHSILNSKVAMVAILNLLLLASAFLLGLIGGPFLLLLYPVGIGLLALALTFVKFRYVSAVHFFNTSVIFFLYLWGRSLSFMDRLFSTEASSGHRKD